MSDPTDSLYLRQTYEGTQALAVELVHYTRVNLMTREDLERKAELLAQRFMSLDKLIRQHKELPDAWKK